MSTREMFAANWMTWRLAIGSWACAHMLSCLIAFIEEVDDPLVYSLLFYSVSLGSTRRRG